MSFAAFDPEARAAFAAAYPEVPHRLTHDLRGHPLMTLEALALIAARCERFHIDCGWRAGYLSLAVNERKARELQVWRSAATVDQSRGSGVSLRVSRSPSHLPPASATARDS